MPSYFLQNLTPNSNRKAALWQIVLVTGSLAASTVAARGDYDFGEVKIEGRTMGTTYHATVGYNSYDWTEEDVQKRIEQRLSEINSLMSTYDPESELSQFNSSTSDAWFKVSAETAQVVTAALSIASRSDGAFDPTVGPLVNLWGFGPGKRRTEPPTAAEVEAALARVGYKLIEVRLEPPALRKLHPEVYLDLSAIAKGYAADSATEALKDSVKGVGSELSMIEIGGEIRTYRTRLNEKPWRIGIERPDSGARLINQIVEIDNGDALATSGDYRNFFEHDGKRYSHTINSSTGRPVEHNLATVTVRAPTCMEADALATALLAMGPDKGYDWASNNNVAAVLIERTADGFSEQITPAWQAFAKQATVNPKANPLPSRTEQGNILTYFLITVAVFSIALVGMATGVILSNRRIKGTCGGLAGMQDSSGKTACEMCTNPSPTCSGKSETQLESEPQAETV